MAYQSKSKRMFLATSLSAALVATVVAPTAGFAATAEFPDVAKDHPYYSTIKALAEAGVVNGMPNGNFDLGGKVTRAQASAMVASILKLEADAPATPFADVKAGAWYTDSINALYAAGIIKGLDKDTFAPNKTMTRAEFAQLIVTAYDIPAKEANTPFTDVKAGAWYEAAINTLYAEGLINGQTATTFGPNETIKRGDFAWLLANTDNAFGDIKAPAVVKSVSAINAKTIEVKFNNAIDAKTLKNGSQDVITVVAGEGANNAGTVSQELSADGKTLTLTATSYFKGEYTVKVPFEIVKDVDGKYVSPVNQKVSVDDKVGPVLASAKATVKSTSDKVTSVTLTFDEALESIEVVKIAGVNYTPVVSGNTATISGLSLDATKAYEVTVVNAKDAARNTKDVQSGQLNISVDNVAPSITSVVATGENTVKVTLDKALKDNKLEISGKVGSFAAEVIESTKVSEDNSKEYTLTLKKDYLFKSGSSDVVTLKVAKEKLVDVLGNSNSAEITKTVTVSKDTVAPAVTKVDTTVTNGKVTAFTVNFAEEVKSLADSKVYVVNSKGEILELSTVAKPTIDEDNKKVVFTLVAGIKADTYSFDLLEGFVTDKSLAANKNAKYSFSVNVADATQPVETAFTITGATEENNVVTVNFGQKVKATGTGSALNPLAYSVNGVALPADAKVEFGTTSGAVDQSKVIITLPADFVKANDTAAVFRVTEVQTLDNKVSNPFIKTIDITDNTAPEALSFVATELKEITVTYSEAILLAGSATISDEITLTDSKGDKITITGKAVNDGKLVLTVADASAVSKLSTVASATIDVKDAAGNAQKAGLTVNK